MLLRFVFFLPFSMLGVVAYSRITAPPAPQIPPSAPLPSPNGFDAYIAAAQAILPANPPVDSINDVQRLTPQQAAVQYSPQRRQLWIAANATAWQKMAQAKTLPCRAPNMRGSTTTFAGWAQLRALSFGQYIRTKDAKSSGQWGKAAELGLDNLEMGINIERGSDLVGSLVGMSFQAVAHYSLEDIPSHLNATQAKSATGSLETLLNNAQPFSQGLTEQKWNMLVSSNDYANSPSQSGFELVGRLFLPHAMSNMAQMMDDFIANADKPVGTQTPVTVSDNLIASFSNIYFDSTNKSLFSDARRKSNLRSLLTRLALRAYRAERGSYPPQLSQLTPTYLKAIPIDPFGKGEPLRYVVQGDSYTLWSIGPDGVDDKGVSIQPQSPRKRVVASADSRGDIVTHP